MGFALCGPTCFALQDALNEASVVDAAYFLVLTSSLSLHN